MASGPARHDSRRVSGEHLGTRLFAGHIGDAQLDARDRVSQPAPGRRTAFLSASDRSSAKPSSDCNRWGSIACDCVSRRRQLLADVDRQLKLWLISPPPPVVVARTAMSGREVLAWAREPLPHEFDVAHASADAVTRADSPGPADRVRTHERPAEFSHHRRSRCISDRREVLGTTFNVDQYTRWLAEMAFARAAPRYGPRFPRRPHRPGRANAAVSSPGYRSTPELATRADAGNGASASPVSQAVSTSYSRLDAGDVATRSRYGIELLNLG